MGLICSTHTRLSMALLEEEEQEAMGDCSTGSR